MPSFSVMYSVTPAASPCTSARLLSLPSSSSCCVLPDVADSAMSALPTLFPTLASAFAPCATTPAPCSAFPTAPPVAMEMALSPAVMNT